MKKIKIKITPDVSGQASGVRFSFENFFSNRLRSVRLVLLRFGIIYTEGLNGNSLHTLIL